MKYIFCLLVVSLCAFGSSLDELVDYALKNSTVVKKSVVSAELAKLKRKESKASQYGSVGLSGEITHYNTARTLAPLTPSSMMSGMPITTTKTIYTAGIVYAVPLFTGYAQTRQVEIDDIAKSMAEVKMKLTKEQLVYNIRSLYLSILAQKELLIAQNNYTEALLKLTQQIADEVRLGKKAKIDLLKAKANLQSSQTSSEMTKANIEIMKATLSSIVTKSVGNLSGVDIDLAKPSYDMRELYSKISNLSRVAIDDMSIKKASKMVDKSKSSKYPQINFNSYVGKNYGEDRGINGWDDETMVQVGLSLKYTIYDFGKRDISIQKAQLSKLEAKLGKEQSVLDIKKMLVEAVQKINQSYAEYLGNSKQYELSKKSESIESVRYQNGVSTLNDLLLAKSKTELASAKVIQGKYNYKKSIYYLDYILERGIK